MKREGLMPVYTGLLLVCDVCNLEIKTYEFTDPVLACSEYGWEYHKGNKTYCQDCQHGPRPANNGPKGKRRGK